MIKIHSVIDLVGLSSRLVTFKIGSIRTTTADVVDSNGHSAAVVGRLAGINGRVGLVGLGRVLVWRCHVVSLMMMLR